MESRRALDDVSQAPKGDESAAAVSGSSDTAATRRGIRTTNNTNKPHQTFPSASKIATMGGQGQQATPFSSGASQVSTAVPSKFVGKKSFDQLQAARASANLRRPSPVGGGPHLPSGGVLADSLATQNYSTNVSFGEGRFSHPSIRGAIRQESYKNASHVSNIQHSASSVAPKSAKTTSQSVLGSPSGGDIAAHQLETGNIIGETTVDGSQSSATQQRRGFGQPQHLLTHHKISSSAQASPSGNDSMSSTEGGGATDQAGLSVRTQQGSLNESTGPDVPGPFSSLSENDTACSPPGHAAPVAGRKRKWETNHMGPNFSGIDTQRSGADHFTAPATGITTAKCSTASVGAAASEARLATASPCGPGSQAHTMHGSKKNDQQQPSGITAVSQHEKRSTDEQNNPSATNGEPSIHPRAQNNLASTVPPLNGAPESQTAHISSSSILDANKRSRSILVDTYAPYIQPNDTSLASARDRLRKALDQTRMLRAAFTDRVYKKYRVILRPVPKTVDIMVERIKTDPFNVSRRLQDEIRMVKDEKEMEKKEAQKLAAASGAKNTGDSTGPKTGALGAPETAEQLAFFGAGLSLVILPEDEIDEDDFDIREYEHRAPINPETGHRVGGISSAAAAAAETILDRVRKSAGSRMERQRKQQSQLLAGEGGSVRDEGDNGVLFSHLHQVPSSSGAGRAAGLEMGLGGPRGSSTVSSVKKSSKQLHRGSSKGGMSQSISAEGNAKSNRVRSQLPLSGNSLLSLSPNAEGIGLDGKPTASTTALIACGVGSSSKPSSQQQRSRHPHPESIVGKRLSLFAGAAAAAGHPSKKGVGAAAAAAAAASFLSRTQSDLQPIILPPKPTAKQRLEMKPLHIASEHSKVQPNTMMALRTLLGHFLVYEDVKSAGLKTEDTSLPLKDVDSFWHGQSSESSPPSMDITTVRDNSQVEQVGIDKEILNCNVVDSKMAKAKRVTEIGLLRGMRGTNQCVEPATAALHGAPPSLSGTTPPLSSVHVKEEVKIGTFSQRSGQAFVTNSQEPPDSAISETAAQWIDPILSFSVLHALGLVREVHETHSNESHKVDTESFPQHSGGLDGFALTEENANQNNETIEYMRFPATILSVGPSSSSSQTQGNKKIRLNKRPFSETFMEQLDDEHDMLSPSDLEPGLFDFSNGSISSEQACKKSGTQSSLLAKQHMTNQDLDREAFLAEEAGIGGRSKEQDEFETSLLANIRGGGETLLDTSEDDMSSEAVQLLEQPRVEQSSEEKTAGVKVRRGAPRRRRGSASRRTPRGPGHGSPPLQMGEDVLLTQETSGHAGNTVGGSQSAQVLAGTNMTISPMDAHGSLGNAMRGPSAIANHPSGLSHEQAMQSHQASAMWSEPHHSRSAVTMLPPHISSSGLDGVYTVMPQATMGGGSGGYSQTSSQSSNGAAAAVARLQGQQRNAAVAAHRAASQARYHQHHNATSGTHSLHIANNNSLQHTAASLNHPPPQARGTGDLSDYFGTGVHRVTQAPGGYSAPSQEWSTLGTASGLLPTNSSISAMELASHRAAMVSLSMHERAARALLAREQQQQNVAAAAAAQAQQHAQAAAAHRQATATAARAGGGMSSLSAQQAAVFLRDPSSAPGNSSAYAQPSSSSSSRFVHLGSHSAASAAAILSTPATSTLMGQQQQQQQHFTSAPVTALVSQGGQAPHSHSPSVLHHHASSEVPLSSSPPPPRRSSSTSGGSRQSSATSRSEAQVILDFGDGDAENPSTLLPAEPMKGKSPRPKSPRRTSPPGVPSNEKTQQLRTTESKTSSPSPPCETAAMENSTGQMVDEKKSVAVPKSVCSEPSSIPISRDKQANTKNTSPGGIQEASALGLANNNKRVTGKTTGGNKSTEAVPPTELPVPSPVPRLDISQRGNPKEQNDVPAFQANAKKTLPGGSQDQVLSVTAVKEKPPSSQGKIALSSSTQLAKKGSVLVASDAKPTSASSSGMRFFVPSLPPSMTPEIANLILHSSFHKGIRILSNEAVENVRKLVPLMVDYLLAVGVAVPIPRALVANPLKERLTAACFKVFGSGSVSGSIPKEVVAATITTWLWAQHKDCFQRAFAKSGRIDVDPECKWLIHAAVDVSVRVLISEVLENGMMGPIGASGISKAVGGISKLAALDMISEISGGKPTSSAVSDARVASIVCESLMTELCIDREMDAVLPNFEQLVEYLNGRRMEALRAKSQERVLVAALISRRTSMSESFSHAYVSALVRAGEALGHEELSEVVQDEDTMASSLFPFDIFSDSSGAWEDPCRLHIGYTSGLTGDELIKRAHARAMIQKSLKKLQDRHGIKGGTPNAGPYKDPPSTPVGVASGSSGGGSGSSLAASGQAPPPFSRSPSGSLKRKSPFSGSADTPGAGPASSAKAALFSPNHYSSPFIWDSDDIENLPYGRHSQGRSRSLPASRFSFGGSSGKGRRTAKRTKLSNAPRGYSSAGVTCRKKPEGSGLAHSTEEVDWAHVARMFRPVCVAERGSSRIEDVSTAAPVSVSSTKIIAPFCRKLDSLPALSSGNVESDEEEDLSDEAVLQRHQYVLDRMRRKLDVVMEARQQQQQRSRNRGTGSR